MSLTGEPDGAPQKMGVAFADIFADIYSVINAQAALAERNTSGLGKKIDISLLDCMTGVLANQALNFLASVNTPKRFGNAHPNIIHIRLLPFVTEILLLFVGTPTSSGRFVMSSILDTWEPILNSSQTRSVLVILRL